MLIYTYATLSFDGEKLIPAVGAECCFNQEICRFEKRKRRKNTSYISKHNTRETSNKCFSTMTISRLHGEESRSKDNNLQLFFSKENMDTPLGRRRNIIGNMKDMQFLIALKKAVSQMGICKDEKAEQHRIR